MNPNEVVLLEILYPNEEVKEKARILEILEVFR